MNEQEQPNIRLNNYNTNRSQNRDATDADTTNTAPNSESEHTGIQMKDAKRNKELIRNMTPWQRIKHIWFYHKFAIIASCIAVALIITLLIDQRFKYKDTVLTVAFLNCTYSKQNIKEISEEYLTYRDLSTWDYKIECYDELVATVDDSLKQEDLVGAYTANASLYALLNSEDVHIDLIFSNTNDILGEKNADLEFDGQMMNLELILSEQFLEEHKEELVYSENYDYPIGLDMKNSRMVKEYGDLQTQTILFVDETSENLEGIKQYIEYAFE